MKLALLLQALLCCLAAPAVQAQSTIPDTPYSGTTRTYYVGAVEEEWDYAPQGEDLTMGHPFTPDEQVWVESGPTRIGRRYLKARYVAFTDATFSTRAPAPSEWAHKGLLGPVIRAEVGDSILVVFRNMTSRPYTVHAHGVRYDKASEGAMTLDGTNAREMEDDHVLPGQTFTYRWFVPERAGPGPDDPSSVVWLYHSHVDPTRDVSAGLVGVIVVTRRGAARPDGSPADVDREFVTLFTIFDENKSWYLDENVRRYTSSPGNVDVEEEGFVESNLKHAMNGYLFGNLPLLSMGEGERVRWYLVGMGTEADVHTPHWHGNTVVWEGRHTDTVSLLPAVMLTADMVPDSPGVWMYHCHVDDHVAAGMTGRYEVVPRR